jgi:formyl-CoA transferase
VWEAAEYFGGRGVPGPLGSAHRMSAPYQAFRCADGYVTIGAANQRTFEKLAALLGHPEWVADARFASDGARVAHRDTLAAAIEAVTSTRPRAAWLDAFDAAGIPCGPILDYAEAFDTPQAEARQMRVEIDHPALGRVPTIGTPLKLSRTPLDPRRPAPQLGEHTDEVLRGLGCGDAEIAALRASGTLG